MAIDGSCVPACKQGLETLGLNGCGTEPLQQPVLRFCRDHLNVVLGLPLRRRALRVAWPSIRLVQGRASVSRGASCAFRHDGKVSAGTADATA
jgi:hypothetical protein